MEEYIEYLKGKIEESLEEEMHISASEYQEVLYTYISFLDASILKMKAQGRKVAVVGAFRSGRSASYSEYINAVNSQKSDGEKVHEEFEKVLNAEEIKDREKRDILNRVNGIPISNMNFVGELTTRVVTKEHHNFKALDTFEDLIPLDKNGKPLENIKSKYHK